MNKQQIVAAMKHTPYIGKLIMYQKHKQSLTIYDLNLLLFQCTTTQTNRKHFKIILVCRAELCK